MSLHRFVVIPSRQDRAATNTGQLQLCHNRRRQVSFHRDTDIIVTIKSSRIGVVSTLNPANGNAMIPIRGNCCVSCWTQVNLAHFSFTVVSLSRTRAVGLYWGDATCSARRTTSLRQWQSRYKITRIMDCGMTSRSRLMNVLIRHDKDSMPCCRGIVTDVRLKSRLLGLITGCPSLCQVVIVSC